MMLLVSLPEMESEGEGLRISSACLMLEASDTGVSDTGVSCWMDEWIHADRPIISKANKNKSL